MNTNAPTILAKKYELPMHSVVEAMQAVGELDYTNDQYHENTSELTGIDAIKFDDPRLSRTVFRYVIQNILTAHIAGNEYDVTELYTKSVEQSRKYVVDYSWVFAKGEEEIKLDSQGNVAPKKGDKKVMAKDWYDKNHQRILALPKDQQRKTAIAELVKTVGLTDAGASTYWANLKAGKY